MPADDFGRIGQERTAGAQNSGIPVYLVRVAVDYWSTYPDEIDVLVEHADRVEKECREAWERAQDLLGQ